MMQYISPITYLPPGIAAPFSAREVRLARQKLLAEFELSGSTTIIVNGKELTRNDILKLFEEMEHAGNLQFHILVASDPALLRFLEDQIIKPGEHFSLQTDDIPEGFTEWLSPYFAESFKTTTVRMFKTVSPEEFATLVECPWFMTKNDEWEAWRSVGSYLFTHLQQFKSINEAKYHSVAQAKKYAGYNFVWLLCNLPESYFADFLDNYAYELMRLAIKEFNFKKRDYAFELIGYAKSLHISEDMRQSLLTKEEEMIKIKKNRYKQFSSSNGWVWFRVALLLLYFFSRIEACS